MSHWTMAQHRAVVRHLPARRRLALLAGIALASLNLRIAVTSIAPLLGVVSADARLEPIHTSILGALPPLVFSACGVLTTAFAHRFGLERSLIVAEILAFVGTIWRSVSASPVSFLVATVVAMAGLGIGNILVPPLIKRYFPNHIALVTTTYTLFLVIGQALPPIFIVGMAKALGWREAVALWALVSVAVVIPWLVTHRWWPARRRPADPPGAMPRRRPRARDVLRSPIAWGIIGMLGANSMGGYCLMAWLPQILIDHGMSAESAAGYLAVFTVGCLFGALAIPPLITRTKHVKAITVAMPLLWLVGLIGLVVAPMAGTAWWILITRLGDSSFSAAITLMNVRSRRPETVVMLSGTTQAFSYLAAAIMSFLFGSMHAATGAWVIPLLVLAVVMTIVGVPGALLASRPVMVEDAFRNRTRS